MSQMFRITLPDGSVREVAPGATPADIAAAIGPGLAKATLAARVNGELRDVGRPFEGDSSLALVTAKDESDALELARHDFAHVLAEATRLALQAGATSVDVAVTHALFAEDALDVILQAGVRHVWSTDCIAHSSNAAAIAPALAQALLALHP